MTAPGAQFTGGDLRALIVRAGNKWALILRLHYKTNLEDYRDHLELSWLNFAK